jgi:hypothetical protein
VRAVILERLRDFEKRKRDVARGPTLGQDVWKVPVRDVVGILRGVIDELVSPTSFRRSVGLTPRVALASVVESTTWLYGDLQGIAGRSLLEIDGLELPLLDGPNASEAEWWSA